MEQFEKLGYLEDETILTKMIKSYGKKGIFCDFDKNEIVFVCERQKVIAKENFRIISLLQMLKRTTFGMKKDKEIEVIATIKNQNVKDVTLDNQKQLKEFEIILQLLKIQRKILVDTYELQNFIENKSEKELMCLQMIESFACEFIMVNVL